MYLLHSLNYNPYPKSTSSQAKLQGSLRSSTIKKEMAKIIPNVLTSRYSELITLIFLHSYTGISALGIGQCDNAVHSNNFGRSVCLQAQGNGVQHTRTS